MVRADGIVRAQSAEIQRLLDRRPAERDEDALAPILDGGDPRGLTRKGGPLDVELQLAVHIRNGRLEPREADLRGLLAQPMDLDDTLDAARNGRLHPRN